MEQNTLNIANIANVEMSSRNKFYEKVFLIITAIFLLVLSIVDCKINDRFAKQSELTSFSSNHVSRNGGNNIGKNKLYATKLKRNLKNSANRLYKKTSNMLNAAFKENQPVAKAAKNIKPLPLVAKKTKPVEKKYEMHLKEHSNISFAPEVGIAQNVMYNSNNQATRTNGIQAGIIANIDLNDHVSLQPGIKYAMKGSEYVSSTNNEAPGVVTLSKVNLNYVEVPMNIVYKFGKPGNTRIIAGGGPYMAYLLKTQDNIKTTATTTCDCSCLTSLPVVSTAPKNIDYGINGFVGCEMPDGFFAKAGMGAGLQQSTDHNYNITISVGYLIGGNK